MELLGGFYAHLDLENHGTEWRIYWNLHLDSSSRVQVKFVFPHSFGLRFGLNLFLFCQFAFLVSSLL